MKNLIRVFLLLAVAGVIFSLSESLVFVQKNDVGKLPDTKVEEGIKITLIADASEFEIKEHSPVSVIVRVENQTDKKVRLTHSPFINLERVGISESEKTKLIWGNYYTGRIASGNSTKSEKGFLEQGEHLDFAVNITNLEWKDDMSSFDYWRKMFVFMEKGEYFLNAQVFIDFSDNEKGDIKDFSSNKIKISYK